ncbi:MAG: UvrD-helicase domain-containing protein [Candidatus Sumerlaeaceae bacterium]|nr:UvrD-helicase domain-containing protein [Candidatus Sumerlaeaceae bacterium]
MIERDRILSALNPQQLEAVTAPDVPVLIVAGAGSGKTRVITRRVAFLIRDRGYRPWQIFAATFTNKAAAEMKRRVVQLLPHVPDNDLHIATFHSLCARILRREITALGFSSNFTIADERDQLSAIKHVMRELGISEKEVKPGYAQEVINQCKIRLLDPLRLGEYIESRYEEQLAAIYEAYEKYIHASSALDFEDLILMTVRLFTERADVLTRYQEKYLHVMVDEFQDINDSQFALVRLLTAAHHHLTVVGDEDQTIYSWRGADIRHILEFEKYYPERIVVRLEQNYRSTQTILNAANAVISHNTERFNKTLFTELPKGLPVLVLQAENDREEARAVAELALELSRRLGIAYSEMAIFYRTAALSRTYEEQLRSLNMPYRVVGGVRFYDRAEVKDMLAYLQVAQNPRNTLSLLRIINTPKRGLGDKTIGKLLGWARQRGTSLFDSIENAAKGGFLPAAATSAVAALVEKIRTWHADSTSKLPSELFAQIREDIGYDESLGDPEQMEVRSRLENLDELYNSIVAYERETPEATLASYLENVSLLSPVDEAKEGQDAITLMTLHMAKGLEFRCVFIVGCNEGLLPHARSVEEGHLEEERRLFYVGMTRAREVLVLSHCSHRTYYGEPRYDFPSPFLEEIPSPLVLHVDASRTNMARFVHDLSHGKREPPSESQRPNQQFYDATSRHELVSRQNLSPRSQRSSLVGKRVRHPLIGEGVVIESGGMGKERWYVVEGDDGSRVKFLARYAQFEVCE